MRTLPAANLMYEGTHQKKKVYFKVYEGLHQMLYRSLS